MDPGHLPLVHEDYRQGDQEQDTATDEHGEVSALEEILGAEGRPSVGNLC